jgi:DNA polymerase V
LMLYQAITSSYTPLPYVENGIWAGFPSPADDFLDLAIDLNSALVQHPSATFYARVRGDSMIAAGIADGDLLIVDRSIEVQDGKIAVCCLNGEFTVKRLLKKHNCCWLMPANNDYAPIKVSKEDDFLVWGMVIHIIKSL